MIKIAYCIESFYNFGGMEKVLSVKANWLAKHDFDISILVANQQGLPYAFNLDYRVKLIDLKCDNKNIYRAYKELLKAHLENNSYDIVISLGGLDIRFLKQIQDNSRKIIELHFAWNRFIKSGKNLKYRIKGVLQTILYLAALKQYRNIVVLTNHDASVYKRLGIKTRTIYNPCTIDPIGISDLQTKRVISVGRLDFQKGYDYLIKAWKIVEQEHPEWELHIFGDGPKSEELKHTISDLKEKNVFLRGKSTQLSEEYLLSSFFVMSSRYEGFPLVLIEASMHGLPLIAYDCIAGPREIILNSENGFLIKPVGDIKRLADAINKMIECQELRNKMGANALERSRLFNVENIMGKWLDLFNNLLT